MSVERSGEAGRAVFLSYASQDAEAVRGICDALRSAGVEVWFDQSELRGGDAWDAKIRGQIASCALFVPVISANTQARREGYFRIEWRLAAQRTHAMSDDTAFLLPVVIDETPDGDAKVPAEFKNVQWTRLRPAGYGGQALNDAGVAAFCARVEALLSGEVAANRFEAGASLVGAREVRNADGRGRATPLRKPSRPWRAPAIAGVAAVVALALWQPWKPSAPAAPFPKETKVVAAPTSPVDALVAKARALLDDDPLMTRGNVELAEQLSLEAIAREPTHAEAYAVAAWANFRFISENYDVSPQRRADLRKYAQKARLLAPDSVNAELAMCGLLRLTGGRAEAIKRLQALEARVPKNFTVLRELAWASALGSGRAEDDEPEVVARLWAFSPLGRAYAESMRASRHWVRAEYVEADRLLDGIFASGHPVRMSYMNRLLVQTYGWGDLATAQAFVATIPSKLLLEDAFINHVTNVWLYSGDYEKALATLDRTQREMLQEARVAIPTAMVRGNVLAAAGRLNAAAIQWREALKLVDKQLTADPASARFHADKALLLAALGERETAAREFALVAELTHPAAGSIEWGSSFEYYAAMGDIESAIPRLDRLIARDYGRWPNVYNQLRYWPALVKLRQDPRGQAMLARGAQWLAEMKAAGAKPSPAAATISAAPAASVNDKSAAADKSVAVLAFANLSDDKANEYFSDGISEELLNVLAKIPGLKVSARTSAFHFKGKDTPIPEIARQLGVAYVVEGSVRKSGTKVRITAQLIKAADGFHVWSDTFTRELKDIFAAQDEIAGLIAKQLSLTLGGPRRTQQIDPEAHRLLLEGRHLWNLRSGDGLARAETFFERAAAIAPDFAELHADWALLEVIRANTSKVWRGDVDIAAEIERGRARARRSLALNPSSGEATAALAYAMHLEGKLEEADRLFRRALELQPNSSAIHSWYAQLLAGRGYLSQSLAEHAKAYELDPLSAPHVSVYVAELVRARRFEDAVRIGERVRLLHPNFVPTRAVLGRAYAALGRNQLALEEARFVLQHPDYAPRWQSDVFANAILYRLGATEEATKHVERLLENFPAGSFMQGFILTSIGRFGEALPMLSRIPNPQIRGLYYDEMWDPWREDPRFAQVIATLGLTQEYQRAWAELQATRPKQKPKP